MRTVIDANIWISAVAFNGPPLQAVDLALEAGEIFVCPEIVEEVRRVLAERFVTQAEPFPDIFADYQRLTRKVFLTGAVQGVCRDPKDDMVLEAALLSNADYILTGDKDLLTLGSFHTARILTARDFLREHGG